MSRKLRTASVAGVTAVALLSLTGGTAQAAPPVSGKWLYLSSIRCDGQEDWRQDEITIQVNGKRVWTEFMDKGDKFSIHEYIGMGSKATIKVVELDGPDPDDVLGKHTVSRKGSGVLRFNSGADYKLSYKIGHS